MCSQGNINNRTYVEGAVFKEASYERSAVCRQGDVMEARDGTEGVDTTHHIPGANRQETGRREKQITTQDSLSLLYTCMYPGVKCSS